MGDTRILVWDIETSPMISYNWGAYESNALEIIQEPTILCFAYKWLGDKKTTVYGQDTYSTYKPGKLDDYLLVRQIWNLFNEADVIIAHNGNSFDQKTAQARMMVHNFPPPEPYQQIDTKLVAKRYGRFSRNKLDDLGKQFKLGQKMHHEGWDMWKGVMEGKQKAWKMMKKYCKQDVILEEKLYLKLRPWIQNHPNLAIIKGKTNCCPKCNSSKLKHSGYSYTKTLKRKRYQCMDCGGWYNGRIGEKTGVEYIN